MLTDELASSLGSKLRARRAELIAALDLDLGDGRVVELDQTRVGRLSRMDAIAQKEMSRATRARMQTDLRRVDAALARLESGRYGICCRCQEPVEADRLTSDPATPFCLPCLEEMTEEREGRSLHR